MKTRLIFLTLVILFASVTIAGAINNRIKNSPTALSHENATEQALTIENWMVNEFYWKCMNKNCLPRDYDRALPLESWMTDVNTWEYIIYLSKEVDKPMGMEFWMTDENVWKQNQEKKAFIPEEGLRIESWMTDAVAWEYAIYIPNEFEGPVNLESWMTDDHVWSNGFSKMVFAPGEYQQVK